MTLRGRRLRPAFTLIELLVVIGIIMVLIGILVPAISQMRKHQQTASTKNQMVKISGAIGNYFNDFQGYPGALPNKYFAAPTASPTLAGLTDSTNYTQTEDCVMALVGGWEASSSGTGLTLTFKSDQLGQGPMSFNANTTTAKRNNAYMEYRAAEFTPLGPGNTFVPMSKTDMGSPAKDSAAPEFIDQYSSPRPILYLRANPGGAVGDLTKVVYNSKSGGYKADVHYDFGQLAAYSNMNSPPAKDELKDFSGQTPAGAVSSTVQTYFSTGSGASMTARNAGSYILIGAGPDRVFGTSDDIIIGAGGAQ